MDKKTEISKNDSKSSWDSTNSDTTNAKKVESESSKDELKSSLKKVDSNIKINEDKSRKSKDDSKSHSEKNDFDIDVIFEKPAEEAQESEDLFQSLVDPAEESGPKTKLNVDDEKGVNDMTIEHETSKGTSPFEIQEKSQESAESSEKELKSVSIDPKAKTISMDDEEEQPVEQKQSRWRAKQRPSAVRRKMAALEKKLTPENINKKVSNIFYPEDSSDDSKEVQDDYDKVDEKREDVDEERERSYISPTMASLFIISYSTGYSLISLPYYLKMSNWYGVFLVILLGVNVMYSSMCIGWCWIIMEDLWPEYFGYSRTPYQEIGYRSCGIFMKYFVAFNIDVSILLSCTSYITLIADSLENIFYNYVDFCYLIIIGAVILVPFSMFSSYKDMKFLAIADSLLSLMYFILLIICLFLDKPLSGPSTYDENNFASVIVAFGGFSFAYGCGPPLGNVAMDMDDRTMFPYSCATAFLAVILIYGSLSILGYAAYGDDTTPYILQEILTNKQYRPAGIVLDIFYIVQLMTSFVIFLLPSLLQFETRVKCPDRFGFYRVLVRLILIACMLFLVLGVPNITNYTGIVGATSLNLLTFIFPPIFYVLLVRKCPKTDKRKISKKEWFVIIETLIIGTAVLVTSIINVIYRNDPSSTHRVPCYSDMSDPSNTKDWIKKRRE